jgi:hypothetical protein
LHQEIGDMVLNPSNKTALDLTPKLTKEILSNIQQ